MITFTVAKGLETFQQQLFILIAVKTLQKAERNCFMAYLFFLHKS